MDSIIISDPYRQPITAQKIAMAAWCSVGLVALCSCPRPN
jgi:hypothetical protein